LLEKVQCLVLPTLSCEVPAGALPHAELSTPVTAITYFAQAGSIFANTVERKLGNRVSTGRTCTMMDTPEWALRDKRI
jgi:hypothetical protein